MNKKIAKRALEEMRVAKMQVESLEKTLKRIDPGYTKDTVRGSSREFPYTEHPITVEGSANIERETLARELNRKRSEWYRKIRLAERTIREADPEIQDILRRRYELGQTMQEIGDSIGYSKASISDKIKSYFGKV